MTERKSVVSIDVQDSSWKKFAESFAKFSDALRGTKDNIAEAVAETEELEKAQKKQATAKKGQDETAAKERIAKRKADQEEAKAQAKKYSDAEKERARVRQMRADDLRALKESAKWTADIARNVASTAWNAAKWVTLGAIGSGFGLGGLASSAAGARQQSMRLGVNTGELRAANVNFGKYFDAESALGNLANARDDNRLNWIFTRLGMGNPQGRSTGDLLAESLPRLVAAFKATGGQKQSAEATGLTQILPFEELRQLSQLGRDELQETIKAYQKDRQSLNVDDSTGRAWQEFLASMKRAGQGIEVSLIKALENALPYLEAFAKGISEAIDAFVSNGGFQLWIEKAGSALKRLGEYLGSDEFAHDVGTFMGAMHTMATFLAKLFPQSQVKAELSQGTASTMPAADAPPATFKDKLRAAGKVYGAIWNHITGNDSLSVRLHNPGNIKKVGHLGNKPEDFQSFASDDEGIRAIANQLKLYQDDKHGHLDTLRKIISKYSPANENKTEDLIKAASARTGFGADQHLDLSNTEQLVKLILAITKQENGASNFTASGVKVVIQNQTGGSAQATVAAMQ